MSGAKDDVNAAVVHFFTSFFYNGFLCMVRSTFSIKAEFEPSCSLHNFFFKKKCVLSSLNLNFFNKNH